jgi:hypothetical protein
MSEQLFVENGLKMGGKSCELTELLRWSRGISDVKSSIYKRFNEEKSNKHPFGIFE